MKLQWGQLVNPTKFQVPEYKGRPRKDGKDKEPKKKQNVIRIIVGSENLCVECEVFFIENKNLHNVDYVVSL